MKRTNHIGSRQVGIVPALVLSFACAHALSFTKVDAETIVLEPARDATLFEDSTGATASGSGPGLFAGNNAGSNTRRALLLFDVAGEVPGGATVDSAELRLHVDSAPFPDSVSVSIHLATAIWGEGASRSNGGRGAPADTGDATWLHRHFPDELWSQAGGDFDPAGLDTLAVGPEGFVSWTGAALIQLVREWLDNPVSNYGLLLKGEEGAPSTVRRFDSREQEPGDLRPVLTVHFTPSATPTERTTWSALKALWRLESSARP
ncbi:MAG: DNRLRE domain-containing protein [Gemmatimonadetes bacterium]|nr:DNRLRE domain-containing protein [Gemmatimonadota bacterium]